MAAIALYDFLKAARTADVIGAMSVESPRGRRKCFDERVMSVRPHLDQGKTAEKRQKFFLLILLSSKRRQEAGFKAALSLRCIPQLHGAAKDIERRARKHRNGDQFLLRQSIIWPGKKDADVYFSLQSGFFLRRACHGFICYRSHHAGKRCRSSENNRLIDGSLSGHPWF